MPNIHTYDAPEGLGLRPTETGITAAAAAARRVQGEYNEAAAAKMDTGQRFGKDIQEAGDVAVKYIDHQQISHGANALAGLVDAKTKQWNDIVKNADPNDPTVGPKFLQDSLEPDLEKFKSGFITEAGQKWAEGHVDQLRQHMYAKTSADMATMAGQAAQLNHKQTVNSLASAVYKDPSSLDFALKTLDGATEGVVGSSPNLTGTAAATVKTSLLQSGKEAIIKSAVMGMIEKNPNVDLDKIQKKYGEYITGPEIKTFAKAAQAQAKTITLQNKQIEVYQRQIDERNAHAAANKIMEDYVEIDNVTGRPTIKPGFFQKALDLAKMPNAPDGLARTWLQWGEHQQNLKDETVRDNQPLRKDLLSRIDDPNKPTSEIEIRKAEANREITRATSQELLNLQKAIKERPEGEAIVRNRNEFFKRYAPTIDPEIELGIHSELGSQKMYQAEMDARRMESDMRKKGLDPNLVYDPTSEYFFGKPGNIVKYRVSMQDKLNYKKDIAAAEKANKNLTGPGKTITNIDVQEKPPMDGARKAPDGEWYVETSPGNFSRVKR